MRVHTCTGEVDTQQWTRTRTARELTKATNKHTQGHTEPHRHKPIPAQGHNTHLVKKRQREVQVRLDADMLAHR